MYVKEPGQQLVPISHAYLPVWSPRDTFTRESNVTSGSLYQIEYSQPRFFFYHVPTLNWWKVLITFKFSEWGWGQVHIPWGLFSDYKHWLYFLLVHFYISLTYLQSHLLNIGVYLGILLWSKAKQNRLYGLFLLWEIVREGYTPNCEIIDGIGEQLLLFTLLTPGFFEKCLFLLKETLIGFCISILKNNLVVSFVEDGEADFT